MRRKKIGVFVGDVQQNFSSRICRTISAKAEEYGYDAYFFTMFSSYGDNVLYAEGESRILSLPDYSKLDGIIVLSDTLYIPNGSKELYQRLREAPCPVVCIRARVEGFYNVLVDETVSLERMIRHFVEIHNFRDICFMTGKMEMEDAQRRFECYKRVMGEYGIEVTEDMVFYGDYWKKRQRKQ